ncbi:protein VirD4 [Brevundimonas intermedia]|uniref:Protein VirD4 n=1 Tax=Brevundimonas intermedia TaxID=74315 RepID=A0ABQ5T6G4_9CAUL|nr:MULTISPECIES: type IV secretory system conjugative DNA transfer family protein [Brevundimonas]KQR55995.1 conjugal transfer protein TraG [Brevundimonas sp. Leaf168]QYF85870.1 type IV secretory system conjugative DNA transfer family protein [Brevundimonas sp. PAMC22021]GLK47742.1 protein VirD4 [Brevundimonas intermedia]
MTRFASASPATRGALIATAGLAAAAVLGVLTVTIALIGLGRFSGDIDPTRVPGWLWYYRHDPELRRWLAVGLSCAGLVGGILIVAVLLHQRRPLHGAARWASAAEQRHAGLSSRRGVVLGRADGAFLIADGPEHVMLYAPTRTGKGVGVVIPNLLAWPDSVVVLDIKRENYVATAGYRAEAGQTVHLFDPLASDGRTARFNPLAHIDRADPIQVLDELQRMAAMLFPVHDRADPFWAEASRTGFIGVGGYVAATPDRPFTLGEIFRQLTAGDARARLPRIVAARAREGRPLPGPVVAALTDFTSSSENTFASVRQSITTRMGLWLNPRIDAATSVSDFDLRDLRRGDLSLYLGATPDNMLRIQPLYALLFQQLVDLNSRSLPAPADRPTLVLLDEFARLGPAPVLAHAFAWVAGYGLRLLAVLQSPSQLRALYGPDLAEDVMTNCGIEIVFAPKELRIARELSERLGYYTTDGRSRSRPAGLARGRRSTTVSDQRRALMLPQELMQLPQTALIVLKAGLPPVRGRKIAYWRDRIFQRRLRPAPTPAPTVEAPVVPPALEEDPMDFDVIARAFAAEGLPPPPPDADETDVAAWLDRVVDATPPEREP